MSNRGEGIEVGLHFVSTPECLFHHLCCRNVPIPDEARNGNSGQIKQIRGLLSRRAYSAIFEKNINGVTVVTKLGENSPRAFSEIGNRSGEAPIDSTYQTKPSAGT
jgi:hypothetical protein